MPLGTDFGFYGGYGSIGTGGGIPGFLSGLLQPWQRAQGSPYLGASSFVPEASMLPATAAGFVESYIPELAGLEGLAGRLSPGVRQQFQEFRFGGEAYAPGATRQFTEQLLQREDIQGLLRQGRLQEEGAFIGAEAAPEARGLRELVEEQLGAGDSILANLYRPTGFGAEQVTTDIERFISGQESGIGGLVAEQFLGRRAEGELTAGGRQAALSQILGGQELVGVGGGQVFNPFSVDILRDEYQFGLGRGGAIQGHDVLQLGGGVLSTQDAAITADVARALGEAPGGGFGGKRGYRLQAGLAGAAGVLGETGGAITQDPMLANLIDIWYQGRAGSGFGRGLPAHLQQMAQGTLPGGLMPMVEETLRTAF